MNPDTWPKVKEIFEGALAQPSARRAAFLDRLCAGDDFLHREVESLLKSYEQAGSFMEAPAVQAAAESFLQAQPLAPDQRKLVVGQTINHYQIISTIRRRWDG